MHNYSYDSRHYHAASVHYNMLVIHMNITTLHPSSCLGTCCFVRGCCYFILHGLMYLCIQRNEPFVFRNDALVLTLLSVFN